MTGLGVVLDRGQGSRGKVTGKWPESALGTLEEQGGDLTRVFGRDLGSRLELG